MKIQQLIKRLEHAESQIKKAGGDTEASEVMIETIDDNGDFCYEGNFTLFIDDRCDIALSPIK